MIFVKVRVRQKEKSSTRSVFLDGKAKTKQPVSIRRSQLPFIRYFPVQQKNTFSCMWFYTKGTTLSLQNLSWAKFWTLQIVIQTFKMENKSNLRISWTAPRRNVVELNYWTYSQSEALFMFPLWETFGNGRVDHGSWVMLVYKEASCRNPDTLLRRHPEGNQRCQ